MGTNVEIFSNSIPPMKGGDYRIAVNQVLEKNGAVFETVEKIQEFTVDAPSDTLPPGEVISTYPPDGGSGDYEGTLPHVLLRQGYTPWLRVMSSEVMPWMALVLFREGEIFEQKNGQILVTAEVVSAIFPRIEEIPYLAHCRKTDMEHKADMGLDNGGVFGVVTANRAVEVLSEGIEEFRVHLLSLEGKETEIQRAPDAAPATCISFTSLFSFRFASGHREQDGFLKVAAQMARENEKCPMLAMPSNGTGSQEIRERLDKGYVPVSYHFRTGETGGAWYRGPLLPGSKKWVLPETYFYSQDQALMYDRETGMFDCSLAAAWESGRLAGLSDSSFGSEMMRLRRRGQEVIDVLLSYLMESMKKEGFIDFRNKETMKKRFRKELQELSPEELREITSPDYPKKGLIQKAEEQPLFSAWTEDMSFDKESLDAYYGKRQGIGADYELQELLTLLMEAEFRQTLLAEVLESELKGVGQWLSELLLLRRISFPYLVPAEGMLPYDTLRFFFMDAAWCKAMMDGAMSLGIDCTRQEAFNRLVTSLLWDIAGREQEACRCGILIRGDLVKNWPTLDIHAYDRDGVAKKALRMEHLGPDMLLCLWSGTIRRVEILQPAEHLEFRSVDCVRAGDNTVLNLVPRVGDGALEYLARQAGKNRTDMTSADVAVCLMNPGAGMEFNV